MRYDLLALGAGDVLIHAGDCMNSGYKLREVYKTFEWLSTQSFRHIIYVAGNHDRPFQHSGFPAYVKSRFPTITYLQDEAITIDGIKFYGSPWQPAFYNWAFNLPRNSKELEEKWNAIPEDTNVLITHGPPHGILDKCSPGYGSRIVGCELLAARVRQLRNLKLHVFGHIHHSRGYVTLDGVTYANAAVVNESYVWKYSPINICL